MKNGFRALNWIALAVALAAAPARATDWQLWDFNSSAEAVTPTTPWGVSGTAWSNSWDGTSSQVWNLTSTNGDRRSDFTPSTASPVLTAPALNTYPYLSYKVAVSGLPSGTNIDFRPRGFVGDSTGANVNQYLTKTWKLANGTYTLTLVLTDPANFNANGQPHVFDPLNDTLFRIRTIFDPSGVTGYASSFGSIKPSVDYVKVTDVAPSDTTPPTGTLSINGGATATNSTSVTLTLNATDDTALADYALSNDNVTFSAWQPYTTSVPWTLTSGDGAKTVYVQYRDQSLNVTTGTISGSINLDTVAPTGTIAISPSPTTYSTSVTLTLSASDTCGSGVTDAQYSNDDVTYSAFEAYATSKAWTLTSGDGAKTVHVRFRDAAGNVSSGTISAGTTLDTTIYNFWDFVTSTQATAGDWPKSRVPAEWTQTWDGSSSQVWNLIANPSSDFRSDYTLPTPKPLLSAYPYVTYRLTISGVPAGSNVNFQPREFIPNSTGIDSGAYAGKVWALTNGTYVLTVTLTDPAQYFVNGSGQSLDTVGGVIFKSSTRIDFRTVAGVSSPAVYGNLHAAIDSVKISNIAPSDTTAPTGSLVINGGAASTNSTAVTLTLSASDNPGGIGIADYRLSNDNVTFGVWQPYTATVPWTLTSGDGSKTVYVQYRDASANVTSGTISSTILLDTAVPTGTISINESPYAGSSAVTLSLTASDGSGSGVTQARYSNDNVTYGAFEAFSATNSWNLTSGDGLKTVYVQYQDAAGNTSTATISAQTTLDQTAPTGTIVINSGAPLTASTTVNLALTADDGAGSGVTEARYSNDNSSFSAYEAFSLTKTWTTTTGDGAKTVYVQFRDAAGNVSSGTISDGITLNTAAVTSLITLSDTNPGSEDVVHFDVLFSDTLQSNLPLGNISLSAGSLAGTIGLTGANPHYTVTVTLTDPDADGTVGITISNSGVTDTIGNPYSGGISSNYVIHNWHGFTAEPTSQQVYTGGTAAFTVDADFGPITPTFQWKWDDGAKAINLGPTTQTWTLNSLSSVNNGSYFVDVTYDGVTYTSSAATLEVQDHLEITSPLTDAQLTAGDTLSLAVQTSGGFAPLIYVWRKDNVIIPDENGPSFSILDAQTEDSGDYSVEVSDANGDDLTVHAQIVVVEQTVPALGGLGLAALVSAVAVVGLRTRRGEH